MTEEERQYATNCRADNASEDKISQPQGRILTGPKLPADVVVQRNSEHQSEAPHHYSGQNGILGSGQSDTSPRTSSGK